MPTEPEVNELFRFDEIAFDVAQIYGSTTEQGLKRARRSLNRAMIAIIGHDRKWSWLKVKDSFNTVADTREYSLPKDVRADIQHMWMEDSNRGMISRIPTTKFVKREPDAESTTGTPTLFDYEGVDSSGCVVISLYPTPSSAIEVFYRYTRRIKPIDDGGKDVRSYWGLPDEMLEALIQKAAALCVQGSNNSRYMELTESADFLIEEAYRADQSKSNTRYIAGDIGEGGQPDDGPRLPPEFGE